MLPRFARLDLFAFALVAFALSAGAARADDLADFNAAAEAIAAHNRVAIGYLRNGNTDLASLELDKTRAAWGDFSNRFSGRRPDVFKDNTYYVVAVTDISTRLITADMMLNAGRPEIAGKALSAVRDDFYKLRKSAGIVVLADCIYDSNSAMDALMTYNDATLDLSKPETATDIMGKTAAYTASLGHCDGLAGDAVRNEPEFRRLVDGAKASLTLIPKAIATNDAGLLHRVLIELRSFDNLLAFRFG
jgi:hypothetical protein